VKRVVHNPAQEPKKRIKTVRKVRITFREKQTLFAQRFPS